jgi:LacI family transcriptional regulator
MRDVAALAGVALKTVSRVINDVPTVDPAMAQRVRQAANKLGYRPNFAASTLRSGRTNTIGLLLDDVSNPFSAVLHRAIEDYARDRGVLLLTSSLDEDPQRERELVSRLIDRRVDGLIIVPAADDHRYIVAEQERGTSFVFVDREPRPLVADAVVTDNRLAAARAVANLARTGRHRIAYLGDRLSIPTAAQRHQGYHDALAAAGISAPAGFERHGLRTVEDAKNATHELITQKPAPDALFTSQNLVTIGAIQALHETSHQQDIALAGFDDVTFAETLNPGITAVAQNIYQIGHMAAERLFARISGDRSPARVYIIESRLITRGSGEIPLPTRSACSA